MTTDQIGDETALPDLIVGIASQVTRVLADAAY
ncbi:MAG TPA: IS5/IS1182 family transposase, partial [Sulfitobacter sp.]|nr:IS5/IS1182 family transposase [Sulfitobacter sp.]